MTNKDSDKVFDYRALRLLIGLIAFTLPFVVSLVSSVKLTSISASYYTDARNIFVGLLFVVSAFFWAYNGHSLKEKWASKGASLSTILVAMFPTSCNECETDFRSMIHYSAAAILFIILAYFCFWPFRKNTKGQKGKKGRRSKIYFICGCIIAGCIVSAAVLPFISNDIKKALSVTYWAEAIGLWAFGFAWIVAGKSSSLLADLEEKLQLLE